MNAKELPARPSLDQYKKQAKDLLKACKARDPEALQRIKKYHLRFDKLSDSEIGRVKTTLADAQLAIAREHGFESWLKFAKRIEDLSAQGLVAGITDPYAAFIKEASVPLDGSWHASGALVQAQAILAAHPKVAHRDIYTAAILGDDSDVRKCIALDARSANAKGGPLGWDALTYLCFSRYLRLDKGRSAGFVRAASALLDAGAHANTGWFEKGHHPEPVWESAIYGAAGLAHHAELTRLLLEHGADPNDEETPYHAAETYDNAALKVLVESGKLNEDSLTTLLLRKADWHDYDGIKWLLQHGASPNRMTRWGNTALHHAVLRDNRIETIKVMLDYGGDPTLLTSHPKHQAWGYKAKSSVAMAARRGRRDALELFEQRGITFGLEGVERLIAACNRNDATRIHAIIESEPHLVGEILREGGTLLAEFAGNGNADGIRLLLDIGVNAGALYKQGDGYFGIAENSTALHVAAWKAYPAAVRLLIGRCTPVDALDGKGRTALALAVRACVDSYWSYRRTPESVEALLRAGASMEGVKFPCGYAEVDELLQRLGKMD
jgi:ankyrin repeat protein